MEKALNQLHQDSLDQIQNCLDLQSLENLEKSILGKKGSLTEILKGVKDLSPEEKPTIGKLSNQIKKDLEDKFSLRQQAIKHLLLQEKLTKQSLDVTLPPSNTNTGHTHPLSQLRKEVEEIFQQMGFSIHDGPHIESEYYNFEALNIPSTHPARDMQDTFFIDKDTGEPNNRLVLRTHTSGVQVRSLLKHGAPLKIIIPGRVFRYEATDATHDSTFEQVEGLVIDKNINLSHLKGYMEEFLTRLFNQKANVRFRPGYFPFVEPGMELDFACPFCQPKDKTCKVCKGSKFIEFMGCGMVHPNVLKSANIDPDQYQGFAFGFGITRLLMMKHKITDIRHIHSGDLRFLKQF